MSSPAKARQARGFMTDILIARRAGSERCRQ
jgi:hypothetical protein